ncbi:MAG: AraC family transcriptional regulator [Balneolaceae bacterium]
MQIFVKNMVSKRCILCVNEILKELDIIPINVGLGIIETKHELSDKKLSELNNEISKVELELCEKKVDQLVERIKHVIFDYVYNIEEQPHLNFSDLLSAKIGYSYNYLSNVFFKQNCVTIQQFVIRVKIERVKELLMLGEHTLTEISYKLQYSSCAHLSNQFKKATGLCPSDFIKMIKKKRKSLQKV